MATLVRPELLLLDEHLAALDPRSAEEVLRLTQEMIERDRLTVLMVGHSMQQVVRLGDRAVMMHRGRIVHDFSGTRKRASKSMICWAASRRFGTPTFAMIPPPPCGRASTCGSVTSLGFSSSILNDPCEEPQVHMPFDSSGQGRPDHPRRVLWKNLAPRQPQDNPQYAMYKDVLDAVARLVGEDTQ